MIQFGPDICKNLDAARTREWLETNGIGGFASSTIAGINTRRYHGLLVASLKPPVERFVLLSKFEETLILDGKRFDLSANQYPGVVHPNGYQYLQEFRLDPFPVFVFEVEGTVIEKSVFMIHGENSTVVQYVVKTQGPRLELEVRPLIAFRDYHSTAHENATVNSELRTEAGIVTVVPYAGLVPLHFAHNAEKIEPSGAWYRNFEYSIELQRGLDWKEDLYNPFTFVFDLNNANSASVIVSTERRTVDAIPQLQEAEITRRQKIVEVAPSKNEFVKLLVSASEQFIVSRGDRKSIIAGYHWFSDWGRDTMIALPGLTMTTGRLDVAKDILRGFARHVDRGMLPNRFPDAGEQPEYNTVDATLWFFEAARCLLQAGGDSEFVRSELYDVFTDIIEWHVRGTRYNIHIDADGLLFSGEQGVQLTWMDAKVGDWVVTPRIGKPVEIQALWYNALRIMENLARDFGNVEASKRYRAMADQAKQSFNASFWNAASSCLYDVVDGNGRDASIRPNQILAVSLEHTMLPPEKARQVVETVERELLTPYGLRTLSTKDPQYRGVYEGGPRERDSAYHQGTVWPWLIGPFVTAYLKVNSGTQKSKQHAKEWLGSVYAHLFEAGLGQISEIFSGDPPHLPGGCIAQAWSVSEILRALVQIEKGGATKSRRIKRETVSPVA